MALALADRGHGGHCHNRSRDSLPPLERRERGGPVEDAPTPGPPGDVALTLEQALELLAALEDARDFLVGTDHLSVLVQVEEQIQRLSRKLGQVQRSGV